MADVCVRQRRQRRRDELDAIRQSVADGRERTINLAETGRGVEILSRWIHQFVDCERVRLSCADCRHPSIEPHPGEPGAERRRIEPIDHQRDYAGNEQ